MLDDLLIGGVAGAVSRTATAPLELYKIQRQNQYIKDASIRSVLKKEGIRYLWKGNMTNCIRIFPQIATNFSAFESSKKYIFKDVKDDKLKNFYSPAGVSGVSVAGSQDNSVESTTTFVGASISAIFFPITSSM